MKSKIYLIWMPCVAVIFIAVALAADSALARTGNGVKRQPEAIRLSGGHYQLSGATEQNEESTLRGGRYQLEVVPQQQAKTLASGGKYQLIAPAGSEDGCCCMFLPCMSK